MMDAIQKKLLEQVADLHDVPQGAYSLRINGNLYGKNDSENISIVKKEDQPGIDIYVKAGTKNESLHIPVILSQSGLKELVYNDFHIGEDCDVTIVAGCGIHNSGCAPSKHSGIHTFHLAKNSRMRYVEKHYGDGDGSGENVMNPTTIVVCEKNSYMEMETAQIKGVDSTRRVTTGKVMKNATLIVQEKIMTHGEQYARTGIQFMNFNTIYQLYDDKLNGRLDRATDMLMIPEYLMWKLSGVKAREYTHAQYTTCFARS